MRFLIKDDNYAEVVVVVPIVSRIIDTTENSSDKTYTVPDGELWRLLHVYVTLVTTAKVGNRQVVVEGKNSAGLVLGRISAGAVQAASSTKYYNYMQGTYRETAFINNDIQVPIPVDVYLSEGASLHVYDSAAIDAAADDMTVSYSVQIYKGC